MHFISTYRKCQKLAMVLKKVWLLLMADSAAIQTISLCVHDCAVLLCL